MSATISLIVAFLGLTVMPDYGWGQTAEVDRSALTVWEQYAQCEETMTYRSCFDQLSDAARRGWADQQRILNADEYERYKLMNDYADLRLTLLRATRRGEAVNLRVLASGMNEGRPFLTYQEYVLVRERGRWKMDRREVHGKPQLP